MQSSLMRRLNFSNIWWKIKNSLLQITTRTLSHFMQLSVLEKLQNNPKYNTQRGGGRQSKGTQQDRIWSD